jgi:hypothetical protein
LVWLLPLDLSGMGDPTSSYATTGIALRVSGALKSHHHDKVETSSVGIQDVTFPFYTFSFSAFNENIVQMLINCFHISVVISVINGTKWAHINLYILIVII